MDITNSRLMFGLYASATSSQHNVTGEFQIGSNLETYQLQSNAAYSLKANCPAGGAFYFSPYQGLATIAGTWVSTANYQSIQLVNGFWGDGVIAGVTAVNFSASITGLGAIDLDIAVTEGETPEVWGQRIVNTINSGSLGITGYKMRLSGTELILETDLSDAEPDIVTIDEAFLITKPKASASQGMFSTLVTPPSPYGISGGDGNDFDGNSIGTIAPQAILIKAATPFVVALQDTGGHIDIPAGGVVLLSELPSDNDWFFTSQTLGSIEIVVVGL